MQAKLESHRHLKLLQYVFFIIALLYFGRALFVPLSFALLISCVLYPICAWLERHKIGRMSAIAISISGLVILFIVLLVLLFSQVKGFFHEWPTLKTKLSSSLDEISVWISANFKLTMA